MRTKSVGNLEWVADQWAKQAQGYGRNQTRNFYFEGPTLYSYGTHYAVARHVANKRRQPAVLFNSNHYSSSTGRHTAKAYRALHRHFSGPVFHVDDPRIVNFAADHAALLQRLVVQLGLAIRARDLKEWRLRNARELLTEINSFADFFGLPNRGSTKRLRWGNPTKLRDAVGQLIALSVRKAQQQERDGFVYRSLRSLLAVDCFTRGPLQYSRVTFRLGSHLYDTTRVRIGLVGDLPVEFSIDFEGWVKLNPKELPAKYRKVLRQHKTVACEGGIVVPLQEFLNSWEQDVTLAVNYLDREVPSEVPAPGPEVPVVVRNHYPIRRIVHRKPKEV